MIVDMPEVTEDEILALDGQCSEKTQAVIDSIKDRKRLSSVLALSDAEAEFVRCVKDEAASHKKLSFRWMQISHCPVCKVCPGYYAHRRRSRYHRRGDPDYSNPILIGGVDLKSSFVNIKNSPNLGCCEACWEKLRPIIAKEIDGVQAEIPESVSGVPPKWKAYPENKCKKCGWTGPESLILRLPAIFSGTYPGECPQCHAQHLPLGDLLFTETGQNILVPVVEQKGA